MAYTITPQRIEELKKFLIEHPIDHAYDEPSDVIVLDGDMPPEQAAARSAYELLQMLGELPEEPK